MQFDVVRLLMELNILYVMFPHIAVLDNSFWDRTGRQSSKYYKHLQACLLIQVKLPLEQVCLTTQIAHWANDGHRDQIKE